MRMIYGRCPIVVSETALGTTTCGEHVREGICDRGHVQPETGVEGQALVGEAGGFQSSTPDCDVSRFGIPYRICSKRATCVLIAPEMIPIPLCAKHRDVGERDIFSRFVANNCRDDGTEIIDLWQFVRDRGVALVQQWRDGEQRFDMHDGYQLYRREPLPYPREWKYRVMITKANAIANAFYVAQNGTLKAIGFDDYRIPQAVLDRVVVPSYELMRNMLLDGDFTDDGDPTGGDYVLACRVALQVTAERYR